MIRRYSCVVEHPGDVIEHAHSIYRPIFDGGAVMPCGVEGSKVELAMRHRLQWFIHLRDLRT